MGVSVHHMPLTFEIKLIDDVAVFRCRGRIVLGPDADALQSELDKQGLLRKKIVLNLAGVEHLDSFGLGTLIRTLGALRANGGDLKLTEIPKNVFRVLHITNLLTVFSAYMTEREGLDAFSSGPRANMASHGPCQNRILCVGTSREILAYLGALLKGAGYELLTSRYLGEAMTLAKVMRPDLVICGAGIEELPTGAAAMVAFRMSSPDVRLLHLPPDFAIGEAGQAGTDFLGEVRSMLHP